MWGVLARPPYALSAPAVSWSAIRISKLAGMEIPQRRDVFRTYTTTTANDPGPAPHPLARPGQVGCRSDIIAQSAQLRIGLARVLGRHEGIGIDADRQAAALAPIGAQHRQG